MIDAPGEDVIGVETLDEGAAVVGVERLNEPTGECERDEEREGVGKDGEVHGFPVLFRIRDFQEHSKYRGTFFTPASVLPFSSCCCVRSLRCVQGSVRPSAGNRAKPAFAHGTRALGHS